MAERSYLYNDVVMQLRARIARGVYRPGGRLPSLAELMEEFEVSAITIRRALRELMYEGVIEGHQGLGVFVRQKPKIHRVLAGDPSRSVGDEIARAGFKPRLVEIDYGEIAATQDVAERLGVRKGSSVIQHRKLTFADEEPVALHVLQMKPQLARRLRKQLANFFVFRLFKEHGIDIANLRCEFSSTPLGEEYSRLFELAPGYAMMRVDYTASAADGTVLFLGQTICRADRFTFEVNLPQPARRAVRKRKA